MAAVALLASVVRLYFAPGGPSTSARLAVGSRVSIPNANWQARKRTLVFALQEGCGYCLASFQLYRDLLASVSPDRLSVFVIVPGPPEEARSYLREHGLPFLDVRAADFDEIGVVGTPTLLLVGADGRLEEQWTGKLPPSKEAEVFRRLGVSRVRTVFKEDTVRLFEQAVPMQPLAQLASSSADIPILDFREREDFAAEHIRGAVNIPIDEIEARVSHELRSDLPLVLYCPRVPGCAGTLQSPSASSFCAVAARHLTRTGFTKLTILDSDLSEVEAANVAVVKGR
jgi:hypothetical protein